MTRVILYLTVIAVALSYFLNMQQNRRITILETEVFSLEARISRLSTRYLNVNQWAVEYKMNEIGRIK